MSLNPAPRIDIGLEFDSETVRIEVAPTTIGLGAKPLTATGGALPTVKSALAGSVLAPPLTDVTSPGLIVFV